jgi:hypothetical protein
MDMEIEILLYFVVPLSLGIVITLTGAIILFVASRKKPKSEQIDIDIESWSTTGGKIISAHLGDRQADKTYEPIIEYIYAINETEYRGNKIFPGESVGSNKEDAQEILDAHPVNSYVLVRYNPKNPAESALEAQPHPMSSLTLAGWVLTGFGVCACCFTTFMILLIFGAAQ